MADKSKFAALTDPKNQEDLKKTNFETSTTKDIAQGAVSGAAQAIPEIVDSLNMLGDLAERYSGLESFLENNASPDSYFGRNGLFPNDLDLGGATKKAVEGVIGTPDTTAGKFAEGVAKFAVGFGPAGKAVKYGAKGIKYATKAKGFAKSAEISSKALSAANTASAFKKGKTTAELFKEGLATGAVNDFLLTDQKDELASEMLGQLSTPVRETVFSYLDGEFESEDLLRKKLMSIPEGIFFGGALNVGIGKAAPIVKSQLIDRIVSVWKKGDILDVPPNVRETVIKEGLEEGSEAFNKRIAELTPEEAAVKDPLEGVKYQGEEVVRVEIEGKPAYVKKSDLSENGTIKSDLKQEDVNLTQRVKETLNEDQLKQLDEFEASKADVGSVDSDRLTTEQAIKDIEAGKVINEEQLNAVGRFYRVMNLDENALVKEFGDDFKVSSEYKDANTFSTKDAENMNKAHDIAPELVEEMVASKSTSAYKVQLFKKKLDVVKDNLTKLEDDFLANPNDVNAAYEYFKGKEAYDSLREEFMEQGSELGRGLRHFGLIKKDLQKSNNLKAVSAYLKGSDAEQVYKELEVARSLVKDNVISANAEKFLRDPRSKNMVDALYSIRVSNLLYGAKTQILNFTSTAASLAHSLGSRVIVAGLSKNPHMRKAALEFIKTATSYRTFKNAIRTGSDVFRQGKMPIHLQGEQKIDFSYNVFKEYADSLKGSDNMFHMLLSKGSLLGGKLVDLPGRTLLSTDSFFKQLKFESTLAETAAHELSLKGRSVDEIAKGIDALRNQKADAQLLKDIGFEQNLEGISRQVNEATFTQDPNEIMIKVNNVLNSEVYGIKPLKWLFPFSNISMNLVRWTANNMPYVNRFTEAGQIIAKGGREAETKQAEIYMTGLGMAGAMTLLHDKITTGGPQDKKERSQLLKAGWKPYSLKTENGYLDLKQLGPIGIYVSMSKRFTDILETLDDTEPDFKEKSAEILVGMSVTMRDIFTPGFLAESSFGISELIDGLLKDDEKASNKIESFLGSTVADAMLPGAGIVSRNASLFGKPIHEFNFQDEGAFLAGFKRVVPWLDTTLKPQVDFLGEDRKSELLSGNAKNLDLIDEMERLSAEGFVEDDDELGTTKSRFFPKPSRKIQKDILGERSVVFSLNNELYYDYQKAIAGTLESDDYFPPYGMSLADKWREQKKAGYPEALEYGSGDEAVATYLRALHKEYKDAAKEYIMDKQEVVEGVIEGEEKAFTDRSIKLKGN